MSEALTDQQRKVANTIINVLKKLDQAEREKVLRAAAIMTGVESYAK